MITPNNIRAARRLIAKVGSGLDWTLSKPYELANGAKVYDVLTEPDGAPALECCLIDHAKLAIAAMNGWPVALDEVERLRKLLAEAIGELHDTGGEFAIARAAEIEKEARRG